MPEGATTALGIGSAMLHFRCSKDRSKMKAIKGLMDQKGLTIARMTMPIRSRVGTSFTTR